LNLHFLNNKKTWYLFAIIAAGLAVLYMLWWLFSVIVQILVYAAIILVIYLVLKKQGWLKK